MDIEKAKRIPLAEVLHILGFTKKQLDNYRTEYGFDASEEEDVITFVCLYLQTQGVNNTAADALRWLRNMKGYASRIRPIKTAEVSNRNEHLFIRETEPLECLALGRFILNKGISFDLASLHLEEVAIFNKETRKNSVGIGLRNEAGGFEVYNEFFSGSIGRQDIAFIRGTVTKPDGIHIFVNIWDYLSAVMRAKRMQFQNDSLILTSFSRLPLATPYIKGYGYRSAYTWMDNTKMGKAATRSLAAFFKTEENLTHYSMNALYAPFENVSAWHLHQLNSAQ